MTTFMVDQAKALDFARKVLALAKTEKIQSADLDGAIILVAQFKVLREAKEEKLISFDNKEFEELVHQDE